MQVFKVKKGIKQAIKVSENNFIDATKRQHPFYQTVNDEKKHYAYCPACENPVLLINLHIDNKVSDDDISRTLQTHARHTRYNVKDLGNFDKAAYDDCPYANPYSSSTKTRRQKGETSDEILQLVKSFPDVLDTVMRRDVGIIADEDLFEKMLTNFKEEKGHLYRFVNRHNLPYSFMYMADSQSLMFQTLDQNYKAGKNLKKELQETLKWLKISKYGKVYKPSELSGFADLKFHFTEFETFEIEGEKYQKFSLVITEQLNHKIEGVFTKETHEALRKEIIFDQYYYQHAINKRIRYLEITKSIFKD